MVVVKTGVDVHWEFCGLPDYPIYVVHVIVVVLHFYFAEEYSEESP
jgi:hypothetical protein